MFGGNVEKKIQNVLPFAPVGPWAPVTKEVKAVRGP